MVRTFAVVVLPGTSSDREETITRQCGNKCDHVGWQICRDFGVGKSIWKLIEKVLEFDQKNNGGN